MGFSLITRLHNTTGAYLLGISLDLWHYLHSLSVQAAGTEPIYFCLCQEGFLYSLLCLKARAILACIL